MKRSVLFLIFASFQMQAEKATFSSQFLKLLDSCEVTETEHPIIEKTPEPPLSKLQKSKNKTQIKNDEQKVDAILQLLTIHENLNPKLYRTDLADFNFKYSNHLEFADGCEGFPEFDEKKLTKAEKEHVKKYGKLIGKGYEAPWYLQYIDEQIGYGAFADEDMQEGQMIGEYTGIVIERNKSKDFDFSYGWSLLAPQYQQDSVPLFFVDARKAGNFTRFINHSYYPNVNGILMYSHGQWHMVYVATKSIKKGEQLLVNYGIGYWIHKSCKPIEMGL